MTALFDLIDYPEQPIHGCAGPSCQVCATRNGTAAKKHGTKIVKRDEEWWQRANGWFHMLDPRTQFTADDLVEAVGLPVGSPNQVGACVRTWAARDLTKPVGVREARRKESHGRLVRIWEVM